MLIKPLHIHWIGLEQGGCYIVPLHHPFSAVNCIFASVHVMDIATEFSDAEAPPSSDQTNPLHFYPTTDVAPRERVPGGGFKSIFSKSPVIHGLVNCAGISPQMASIINSDETFDEIMAANVNGV